MKFAVEAWSADYGTPVDEHTLVETEVKVDPWVEAPVDDWSPRTVPSEVDRVGDVLFVDGVRRVEAHVWLTDDEGVHYGICASYAAGAVRCNGEARVVASEVRRGLFCRAEGAEAIVTRHATFGVHVGASDDPEQLSIQLQQCMIDLEARVATDAGAPLAIVDGPLRSGHTAAGLVGYVKTHHTAYGPPLVREVISQLAVGQRTPLLVVGDRRAKYTWYVRLPCVVSHGLAGVVRLELPADRPVEQAAREADRITAMLPRFASKPQKDPRAPQNLVPIGGLERELRRRLGDPQLIVRALRRAAGDGENASNAER